MVSPENAGQDHSTESGHYAQRDIPAYLIVDVLAGSWKLMTQPEDGVYQCSTAGPFGKEIEIPIGEQVLKLDSSQFARA